MSLAAKALWIVETRREAPPGLAEIARLCGASPFHLSRAFTARFGRPLISYQRSRRLTEAARALVYSRAGVAEIAFDAGYASHEAFTRAFRAEFGVSPANFRKSGDLTALALTNPLHPEHAMSLTLTPPRVENRPSFHVAGLADTFSHKDPSGVPALWARFVPHFGAVDRQVGETAYGLSKVQDDGEAFAYMAGVEVAEGSATEALTVWTIPAARYAIFEHGDHISKIRGTYEAIFDHGLADAGLRYAEGYEVERYDERFDARTGQGVVEIWIPVE